MIESIKNFLKRFQTDRPFVLGLSGGPDSMALYYLLKEAQIPFVSAHVDHGWREESESEATWLQEVCTPVFMTRLAKPQKEVNLEAWARDQRLIYFKKVAEEIGSRTILLAHQADDQAETVMKRIFEGSPLYRFRAIESVSEFEGLTILRPLLPYTKAELLNYLGEREYITDPTNGTDEFLRGRFRGRLIPYLNEVMKKSCTTSFNRFHAEVKEFQNYLDRRIEPLYSPCRSPLGSYLPLNSEDPYELKYLITRFLREEQLPVRENDIQQMILNRGKANLRVGPLFLDRGLLFNLTQKDQIPEKIAFSGETASVGPWVIKVEKGAGKPSTWTDVWQGRGEFSCSEKPAMIGRAPNNGKKGELPAFLTPYIPVIYTENGDKIDFWSKDKKKGADSGFRILLNFL